VAAAGACGGVSRLIVRRAVFPAGDSATGVELSVRGCGAGTAGAAGACSAGRVVVPGRLKFWSSRGPTVSVGGVLVVAGSVVFWASAEAGTSQSPLTSKTDFQRKIALMLPAVVIRRLSFRRGANGAMPAA